jgi:hypothetical protein
MERKNLLIAALSLSAVMMFCTLVVLHRGAEPASAEVSVLPSRETLYLTAASVNVQGNLQALVLIDKNTHMMRVFRVNNNALEEMTGGSFNLYTEFNRAGGPVPKRR